MTGWPGFHSAGVAAAMWWQTRGFQRHRSRKDFEAWQARALQRWLDGPARRVPAFQDQPRRQELTDWPEMDKARLMGDFAAYNRAGITAAEGWGAFEGSRQIGSWHVGASTGTSGNRGLFVISDQERYAWLGAMLGKLLPDFWRRKERVAIILPLHTRLYDAAGETGRLKMAFFDLHAGPEAWIADLVAFDPSLIVAPPRILRWLAETAPPNLAPRQIYAGAEVLDPGDRAVISARWPGQPGQIYMATEGLLGTSCAHGTLHLAEDIMAFEYEPAGESGLVMPRITDFRRTGQIMCRYAMNDLLRLSDTPCACGSPLQAVSEVVGRQDDIFELPDRTGAPRFFTPDVLRNAVLDADRRITDFRVLRTDAHRIRLVLADTLPDAAAGAARDALLSVFRVRAVDVEIGVDRSGLALDPDRKLRRVRDDTRR